MNNIDINRFCIDEVNKISEGIRTGYIQPMFRKEVVVLIKGFNLITLDILLLEYLTKHGRIVKIVVVYEKAKKRPFAGLENGD